MRLVFLGTRAYIDAASPQHRRHSAALIEHGSQRVMIDCGADWRGRIDEIAPDAIVLTHAHPDHAFGLQDGAPCPVHATAATWSHIDAFPIGRRVWIEPRVSTEVAGVRFEAFPVEHSTRCPAVGYRIQTGNSKPIFYAPDVAYIHVRETALADCRLYVGDGATLDRPMIRKVKKNLVGHAPVRQQLTWCQKEGVPEAVFTHCGTEIVAGDERKAAERLRRLANARGVHARFAYDGMALDLD